MKFHDPLVEIVDMASSTPLSMSKFAISRPRGSNPPARCRHTKRCSEGTISHCWEEQGSKTCIFDSPRSVCGCRDMPLHSFPRPDSASHDSSPVDIPTLNCIYRPSNVDLMAQIRESLPAMTLRTTIVPWRGRPMTLLMCLITRTFCDLA
jgi:hypothetical protein